MEKPEGFIGQKGIEEPMANILEKPEDKPETVLEPEYREKILGKLEKFKREELSGDRETFHLVKTLEYPEVDFAGLKDIDLVMADKVLGKVDDSILDSLGEEFESYRDSIQSDRNRSHFAGFLGNILQKYFNEREVRKMKEAKRKIA